MKQTIEWAKVTPEVVSPEESKLNHSVMNKKQGNQKTVFSRGKNAEKPEQVHHSCRPIIPVDLCYTKG